MSVDFHEPEQIGKYVLGDRIALGGMAEVFRAKTYGAAGFVKDVCIKRILPQYCDDPDFVRMFIDEATLAAKLQHANIVQILDFDRAGDTYYIAMELVDGQDLRHIMQRAHERGLNLPLGTAVYLVTEALRGLAYAHARKVDGRPLGVIHRDISPHNILVSYQGEVKLTDFGIAKAAQRSMATRGGAVRGKLGYMSPEQVSGRPVDQRTDFFAMGVILYELCTGSRLFAGRSDVELALAVKRAEIPPPRSRNPEIPVELERILSRMLAREPADRARKADHLVQELSQLSCYRPAAAQISSLLRRLFADERGEANPSMDSSQAEISLVSLRGTLSGDISLSGEVSSSQPDFQLPQQGSPVWSTQAAPFLDEPTQLYEDEGTPQPVTVRTRAADLDLDGPEITRSMAGPVTLGDGPFADAATRPQMDHDFGLLPGARTFSEVDEEGRTSRFAPLEPLPATRRATGATGAAAPPGGGLTAAEQGALPQPAQRPPRGSSAPPGNAARWIGPAAQTAVPVAPTTPAGAPATRSSRLDVADSLLGQKLGDRYLVEERLAETPTAFVYRGKQITTRRPVLLKLLRGALARDPEWLERFRREAQTVSQINHPHIANLIDYGESDGRVYLVSEHVEGRSLRETLNDERRFAIGRALGIAAQISRALAAAHREGVVHRDLRPEVVLLARYAGTTDFVKVIDFSLAKLLEERKAVQQTVATAVLVNPRYMSPEQARGAPLDARSDLYSVGVLAYEMLVGTPPFDAARPSELHAMVAERAAPALTRPGISVPTTVERLIMRALEKDPANRFPDAAALLGALEGEMARMGGERAAAPVRVPGGDRPAAGDVDDLATQARTPARPASEPQPESPVHRPLALPEPAPPGEPAAQVPSPRRERLVAEAPTRRRSSTASLFLLLFLLLGAGAAAAYYFVLRR